MVRDFVMDEVYRLVAMSNIVHNDEYVVGGQLGSGVSSSGSGSGLGLVQPWLANGSSGSLSSSSGPGSAASSHRSTFSFTSQGVLPVGAHTVGAGHGNQKPVLSLSQLTAIIVQKFGFAAYLNRQAKIRSVVDEYLKQARQTPAALPVFLVRNESVLRITLSNIWLHEAFRRVLKPKASQATLNTMEWFLVLSMRYIGRNGSKLDRHKAKSAPTRVQSVDEFTKSKFMRRVSEIMVANASNSDTAMSLPALRAELLKTFPLSVFNRLKRHLEAALRGVSQSDKPLHTLRANQGRAATARLPLNAHEATFAGVNIAMEVGTEVTDFLRAHQRWVRHKRGFSWAEDADGSDGHNASTLKEDLAMHVATLWFPAFHCGLVLLRC